MGSEYVYMHIIPLGIMTVVAGIAAVIFGIGFMTDTYYAKATDGKTSVERKKLKWLTCSALCLCLFCGGLWWWIDSANQPWRSQLMTMHEIKEVQWPDGTKVQMFTCDGKHYNVTEIFNKVVDPKEWVIRRVQWHTIYSGVSWYGTGERFKGDRNRFFLENKNGLVQELNVEKVGGIAK